MARIGTDDPQTTSTAYHAAVHANFFNRSFYFHALQTYLEASDNTCAPAVRIELHCNFVPDEHLYPMKSHFSRQIGKHRLSLFYFYSKEGIRERFFYHSLNDLRLLHNVRRNNSSFRRRSQHSATARP